MLQLHAELRRTANLCRALQLTREQLHALPADTVDELLAIEQAREECLAELREAADGCDADDQSPG